MTLVRRLRARPTVWSFAFSGALCALGCRDDGASQAEGRGEALQESESPSAKIYPAPLEPSLPGDADGPSASPSGSGGGTGKRGTSFALRSLPLLGPIEAEVLPDLDTSGYELDFQVPWPEVPSSVQLEGETHRIAPLLRFHLLPESSRHAARLRIELSAGTLPLPAGTELLASGDAEGWLILWPDHRSYRAFSLTSLRAILEERRVDRVPLVPVEALDLGGGRLLGRDTRRVQLKSSVGTLTVELAEVPELGGSAALACGFFLALMRADPRPHCVEGAVPVHARYQWSKEQALEIGALRLIARSDYRLTSFSLPPRLGIFKPGELPPRVGPAEFEPDNIWSEGRASATWRVVSHHDVPIYFFVDGFPVAWLEPHLEQEVRLPPGDHRHVARDWLGQVVEPGGVASAAPTGEAVASRIDGPDRPTVQYGTPPEPEIE